MHKQGKVKAFHLVRANHSFTGHQRYSASVIREESRDGGVFYYQITPPSRDRVNRAIDRIAEEASHGN